MSRGRSKGPLSRQRARCSYCNREIRVGTYTKLLRPHNDPKFGLKCRASGTSAWLWSSLSREGAGAEGGNDGL